MRGFILLLALVLCGGGPSLAHAKQLPKGYGYGRGAAAPAPLLDLRGLLPAGQRAELAPIQREAAPAPSAPVWAPVKTPAASCYVAEREGGITASGEAYDSNALAAAHPDMPLSSLALVRNGQNGKEAIVRVNDRPNHAGAIEFTPAAARSLGLTEGCPADVTFTRLGAAPYAAPYAAKAKPAPQQQLAEEPAPVPGPVSGAYLVQIGAFAQRGNAEAVREQVSTAGPVSVEPAVVGGASLFRVRLGPWATRAEAEQARSAAADLGFPNAKLLLP